MKLTELENEVLSLMFEENFDSIPAFIASANRALATINTERDRHSECRITRRKTHPCFLVKNVIHRGNEALEYQVKGKALAARIIGKGNLLFTDGEARETIEFAGGESTVKRLISSGEATLSFTGEFDYEIASLAVYESIFSEELQDIELFGEAACYDMKKLDKHFIAFTRVPRDSRGKEISGAEMRGTNLILPKDFYGTLTVFYKRQSRMIEMSDVDCVLDIAPECEHLLPPLCASYLLADDNPDLSLQYQAMFREGMSAVKLYNRPSPETLYSDVTGWAQ